MIKIYTLKHPITNEIRYIGKTKNELYLRKWQHISAATRKSVTNYNSNWVKSLLKVNLKPIIEELDCSEDSEYACFLEKYWISQFKTWGFRLTNLTLGGEGTIGITPKDSVKYLKAISVLQYDLTGNFIQEFKSYGDAKRYLKIKSSTAIKKAVRNKSTCFNFQWREKNNETLLNIGTRDFKNRIRKINQYDLQGNFIKTWNSSSEIAKHYDLWSCNIIRACRSSKSCGGFLWEYYEDKLNTIVLKNRSQFISKPVLVYENNIIKEFSKSRDAAQYLNISYKLLHAILTKKIKKSRKLNDKRVEFK